MVPDPNVFKEHAPGDRASIIESMVSRAFFALLAITTFCYPQNLPVFRWIQEVDGSGLDKFAGLGTDGHGNTYVAGSTQSPNFPTRLAVQNHSASPGRYDVFVTELDPAGNVVYSTYFGGSGDDVATAMTVDAAGDVYVTGTTSSKDFPTTAGTYSPSVPAGSFLFMLKAGGSVGYSTYFSSFATPNAIAVDGASAVYLTGFTYGGLATTPGAYQSGCACVPIITGYIGVIQRSDAFLTKFDAAASKLIYATYLGVTSASGNTLAVASDGSAYLAGPTGVYRMNATGSSLLASAAPLVNAQAMAMGADGSLYVAGAAGTTPNLFEPTTGAFETTPRYWPMLRSQGGGITPTAIVKMDGQLHGVLAGTYFGGTYGDSINALTLDGAGNLYVGGYTSPRELPTLTPLVQGFGIVPNVEFSLGTTGFLAQLSGDLSTLLFSSFFGDGEIFGVTGVAIGVNGSVLLGGATGGPLYVPSNIWVNSLSLAAPPALRIDAVGNAASYLNDPISGGETIVVSGAGFGRDAQLSMADIMVPTISISSSEITAVVPADLPDGAAAVQVQSGGVASNAVLVAVRTASPGLFSADGGGVGQGYILNKDGTLNTPSNPAATGDRVTVYATGVGPVSFTGGYAVTQYPSNLFIGGFYCAGVAAVMGPVAGFPGDVYQLTVYVPNPAALAASNPNVPNIPFPPSVGVILQIDGASSQNGIAISIAQ
jgi:uncharacterized protein (TIGR03437 family)